MDNALVFEWMSRGSLSLVLADRSAEVQAQWTVPTMLQVLLDVARGMDFLHHHNVIHRDLKSPNILVDEDFHAKVRWWGGCDRPL